MSRRRRNRDRRRVVETVYVSTPNRRRAPVRPSSYTDDYRPLTVTYQSYISPKRAPALAPAVSRVSRTVRTPLIRTVRTDTVSPSHLRRRHNPAMLAKARAWLPSIEEWPRFLEPGRVSDRQLHRAETCAKRHIRREVLFAIRGLNGSGGRGKPKSSTRC